MNELEFFEQIIIDLIENLRCVKQRREFENYNVSKLLYVLKTIDKMNVSSITNELKDFVEMKISIREFFFHFISFEHFIENTDEVAVEHYFFGDKSILWN